MVKNTVILPQEVSTEVERKFFEYNCALNVVAFLMTKKEINSALLQEYIDTVEVRGVALELLKSEVANTYRPKEIPLQCDYVFNFDDSTLTYEVK